MRLSLLRRGGVAAAIVLVTTLVGAPAHADAVGLSGTVVDATTGNPVSSATVVAQFPDGENFHVAGTDSSGAFAFPDAAPGQYRVQVTRAGYVNYLSLVTSPVTLQIQLQPIVYGAIAGHVVSASGTPLAGVDVRALDTNGLNTVAEGHTDATGAYEFDGITPASYFLQFGFANGQQVYYPDSSSPYEGTPVVVNPGATTTIDMAEGPVGDLVLTVLDATTGLPLAGACQIDQGGPMQISAPCSGDDGVIRFTGIAGGSYNMSVSGPGSDYLSESLTGVVVTQDHTTTVTVALKRAAFIHLNVIDAATGEPASDGLFFGLLFPTDHNSLFSPNFSGVDLGDLAPGTFKVFVAPTDGVHGAQWVGAHGGTGDAATASTFSVTYGQHLDITVRLDPAGTIAGTITDAATGAPALGVCPSATGPSRSFNYPWDGGCTVFNEQFQLNHLGPYKWNVSFTDYSGRYAWITKDVQVVAGGTVTLNAKLKATGVVTGTITRASGYPQFVNVWAVDEATGTFASPLADVRSDGTYTLTGLNSGDYWIYYGVGEDDAFKLPVPVHMVAGRTVSGIDITVP